MGEWYTVSRVSSPFPQFYDKNLKIMTISRNCVWNVSFSGFLSAENNMGLLDNKYLLYIREHGTTTLPFLLRPLFLWTPAFHPPTHFVHTSLLPGTHTRWGIFRSKNAPQPLQFKTHDEKKNCNTTSDALPTLSKKHACFMVPDNDFDIKKCPILISLRLVDHVLYTSNIYM